jgi:hypothetical protein
MLIGVVGATYVRQQASSTWGSDGDKQQCAQERKTAGGQQRQTRHWKERKERRRAKAAKTEIAQDSRSA